MSSEIKSPQQALIAVAMQVLLAFETQRDPIPDSDLDDEQPIRLEIATRLGHIRRLRMHPAFHR